MLSTVDDVIEALGGTAAAADLAGVKPPAVSNWRERGRIAQDKFDDVRREASAKRQVPLDRVRPLVSLAEQLSLLAPTAQARVTYQLRRHVAAARHLRGSTTTRETHGIAALRFPGAVLENESIRIVTIDAYVRGGQRAPDTVSRRTPMAVSAE